MTSHERNCADRDEDCPSIQNKVKCWLYAPERGMCPFLRSGYLDEAECNALTTREQVAEQIDGEING